MDKYHPAINNSKNSIISYSPHKYACVQKVLSHDWAPISLWKRVQLKVSPRTFQPDRSTGSPSPQNEHRIDSLHLDSKWWQRLRRQHPSSEPCCSLLVADRTCPLGYTVQSSQRQSTAMTWVDRFEKQWRAWKRPLLLLLFALSLYYSCCRVACGPSQSWTCSCAEISRQIFQSEIWQSLPQVRSQFAALRLT